MRRARKSLILSILVIIVGALGFAWGLLALAQPGVTASEPLPVSSAPNALAEALPKAWERLTPTLVPSMLPSLTPSPTPTRRAIEWPEQPTLRPSATLVPSPTATPIHYPAVSDPTRITAPAIGLDAKVVPVHLRDEYNKGVLTRVWEVADYAAGFQEGMARPGHIGNTVITGHNNVRGEVFRDLHRLKPGDDVYVWVGEMPYRYRVDALYRLPITGVPPEVERENLKWILPTDDERLTLVTCWPYWSNTHRTIVVAFPAPWQGDGTAGTK